MPTSACRSTALERPTVLPMPAEPESSSTHLRGNLRASIGDGASYSVMVGLGESKFQPFAVALATGETLAGLVATVPMLVGAVVQLAAPAGLKRYGSHKWWIVGGSAIQGLALLLLPLAALFTGASAAMLILAAGSLYFAGVQSAGPAWNTWIEGGVPKRIRTKFFACRARISQTFSLLAFLGGGLAVHAACASYGWHDRNHAAPWMVVLVFCGLFCIAATARAISVGCLAAHATKPLDIEETGPSFREFFFGRPRSASHRFVFVLLAMQTAVQISGPYFYPYLLQEKNTDYFAFLLLVSVSFLGKVVALPYWGKFAKRVGVVRLFWVTGAAIIPLASLWMFADLFSSLQMQLPIVVAGEQWSLQGPMVYLCLVQLTSGITWGGYELAMTLMFLEAIPRNERTTMMTYYNFGNSAAMMLGSLIGGAFLWSLGEGPIAYMTIFGLSSAVRLVVMLSCSRLAVVEPPAVVAGPQLRLVIPEEPVTDEEAAEIAVAKVIPAPGIPTPPPVAVTTAPR